MENFYVHKGVKLQETGQNVGDTSKAARARSGPTSCETVSALSFTLAPAFEDPMSTPHEGLTHLDAATSFEGSNIALLGSDARHLLPSARGPVSPRAPATDRPQPQVAERSRRAGVECTRDRLAGWGVGVGRAGLQGRAVQDGGSGHRRAARGRFVHCAQGESVSER